MCTHCEHTESDRAREKHWIFSTKMKNRSYDVESNERTTLSRSHWNSRCYEVNDRFYLIYKHVIILESARRTKLQCFYFRNEIVFFFLGFSLFSIRNRFSLISFVAEISIVLHNYLLFLWFIEDILRKWWANVTNQLFEWTTFMSSFSVC